MNDAVILQRAAKHGFFGRCEVNSTEVLLTLGNRQDPRQLRFS